MFFILKDEKTVIAADNTFMKKAKVKSIYLLAELFRVGDFLVNEVDNTCLIDGKDEAFTRTPIQTLLGEAFVYDFSQESSVTDATPSREEPAPPLFEEDQASFERWETPSEEEPAFLLLEKEEEETSESEEMPSEEESTSLLAEEDEASPETVEAPSEEEPVLLLEEENPSADDEVMGLIEEPNVELELPKLEEETTEENSDIFERIDLSKDDENASPEEAISLETISLATESEAPLDLSEPASPEERLPLSESLAQTPFANYEDHSQLIGIPSQEYMGFLTQFAEEALEHEPDLRGNDLHLSRESIASLKDTSRLLNLPKLTDKLQEVGEATSDEKSVMLDDFFTMIQHILDDAKGQSAQEAESQEEQHATVPGDVETKRIEAVSEVSTPSADHTESQEEPEATDPEDTTRETTEVNPEANILPAGIGSVLDHVTSLPFDFSANVAAEELGLPEPLVEEFVTDFVQQAKENISIFEKAQQKGDMETIQKTAHLLKGASSNLRIDPLAKTLEELQYNEDATKVSGLFQRFIGQLKALDNFIHAPGM